MMDGLWAQIFTVGTLAVIIAKTAPLLLAALGGAITQMGNILNIGLEGMMLAGAFTAIAVGAATGSPLLGVLAAVAAGLVLAVIFAVATIYFRADEIVVGIGVNLVAAGLTVLLLVVFYGNPGSTPGDVKSRLPKLPLGPLADIPVIGPAISGQTALVWVAFLAVPVYWFMLYRTRFGVHLRAVGEDAVAASAAGIDARRVKTISILVSGVMCGLAGSQLAMAFLGSFTAGMTSGRGFIAVAALTFGLAKPVRTMIACVIFAAADAIADQMSIAGVNSGLALMTPYIITIAALTVAAIRISLLLRRRTRSALRRSALVPSNAAAVVPDKTATTV